MNKEKLAVILSRFPYPLDKGDKLRAFHQIKYLSDYFDIFLYALHTTFIKAEELNALKPFTKEIFTIKLSKLDIAQGIAFSLLHKYPVQVGYFFSAGEKKKIQEDIRKNGIQNVYCQLSRTMLYAKDLNCRKTIDLQDAFSINYKRLIQESSGFYKGFYQREYKTMLRFEQEMLSHFDHCTIISDFDKQQINDSHGKIQVIPNGVDTDFFTTSNKEKKYDIAFIGNLSYAPNKNAVDYLVNKICPKLLAANSHIKIHIAGADTPQEIFDMANENITVSGFVPDIREVYDTVKIFVAPLFTGAGLQNKILEAMSMQLPCVTTSIVNYSLNAQNEQHLLIADSENEFCEKILSLLHSSEQQTNMGKQARQFIIDNYTWNKANEKLLKILK